MNAAAAGADPNKLPCNSADVDKLMDSDNVTVCASVLFSCIVDVGTGLFKGTVQECSTVLWAVGYAFTRTECAVRRACPDATHMLCDKRR